MNRPLLITIGATILLFMIGLWIYLLAYGAPEAPREVFTNLGFLSQQEGEVRIVDPNAPEPGVQLALGGAPLQQLTTRAVAGSAFASSTQNELRYVERGTGHIFEINLETGTETQISLTTLVQAAEAGFSPSAAVVAITSYQGYATDAVVGVIQDDSTLATASLPANAQNIAFEDDQTLYFSLSENGRTTGYAHDVETLSRSELFTVDLADVTVHWGASVDGIYVQTKPTQYLEGYLYAINNDSLTPLPVTGYGLTAIAGSDYVVASYIEDGVYTATAMRDGQELDQALFMTDKKCAFNPLVPSNTWCAAPLELPDADYLEEWYKGAFISEDHLWFTNLEEQSSQLVANLSEISGRIIDVESLTVSPQGTHILLGNKSDGALWLYKVGQ